MTKSSDLLAVPWLHCNDCHRGFENHNKLELARDGRLEVVKSDLGFSFTGCGHFFCENCVHASMDGGRFVCKACNEASATYKVEGRIPKNLEVYIKPPVSMLEEAVGVMLFQLNNANQLIRSLRAKVSQQKELLAKAKQELSNHKTLKEQVAKLTAENSQLKSKINNFISDSQDIQEAKSIDINREKLKSFAPPPSPAIPNIKVNGRLSLKSPIMSTPPSFRRPSQVPSSNDSWRNPGFAYPPPVHVQQYEPPQTPIADLWNPPVRQHPNMPIPYPTMLNHQTPNRYNQQQQPNYQYPQQQQPPPQVYQPSSTFGSPRPFHRRTSNDYTPY